MLEKLICIHFLLFIFATVITPIFCQNYPNNPCPKVFSYQRRNGLYYGRLEFPNDGTGNYELSVNVSLAALIRNQNIKLELQTPIDDLNNGAKPVYFVIFPVKNILPKVTQVVFNNRVYCLGPPEPLIPGGSGVTNMWASTFLRTNIIQSSSSIFTIPQHQRPTTPYSKSPSKYSTSQPPLKIPTNYQHNPFLNPQLNQNFPVRLPEQELYSKPVKPAYQIPSAQGPLVERPFVQQSSTQSPSAHESPAERPSTQKPTTQKTTKQPLFSSSEEDIFTSRPNPSLMIVERTLEECGVFAQELVVGGKQISKGQFPWLVALFQQVQNSYMYRCTGNLISNKHVLTVAHCITLTPGFLYPLEDFTLVLGKQDIRQWLFKSTLSNLKSAVVHPNYKVISGDYDIAVLTMEKTMEFSNLIKPICLWSSSDELNMEDQNGTVVGWGSDGELDYTSIPKMVNLPVVSNEVCLRSHPGYRNLTSERTFCAGKKNGVGPCTGDSGAGFIMKRKGRWTLRGLVSTALGKISNPTICDLGNYVVIADVYKFLPWIYSSMT